MLRWACQRRLVAMAAFGIALLLSGPALADERAELEKARASFLARNWIDAEERLRRLLDPSGGLKERSLISQARMYLGASLLAQGKKAEGKEVFEQLVLDDPTFEPDPLSFPGEAINTFIDVRSSLLEQIRTASQNQARLAAERKAREEAEREAQRRWFEKVKEQAAEEKITVRHSRVMASIPFGVGQFQNGQPLLGWIFLGAEVACIGGSVVTTTMYEYARSRERAFTFNNAFDNYLRDQWHQRSEDLLLTNYGLLGAFVVISGVGILQANLAFVPETYEKRRRDLPPLETPRGRTGVTRTFIGSHAQSSFLSSIAPLVSPLPGKDGSVGGVQVGIRAATF